MLSVLFLLGFSLFLDSVYCLLVVSLAFMYFFFMYKYSAMKALILVTTKSYMDSLSVFFIMFSFLLVMLILCLSFSMGQPNNYFYKALAVFLLLMLIFFFSATKVFKFYLFFEFSFIMMVFYMLIWGVKPERISAVKYLLIYTFLGSLPLLLMSLTMYYFYFSTGSFVLMGHPKFYDSMHKDLFYMDSYVFMLWVIAFLMKMPVFGLHLWLPKAHVEAPVFGSMLLAGIMLKVGVFGLFRILFVFCSFKFILLYTMVIFFSLGLVFLNLVCLRQFDLKSFVAYSSVVHMSLISMSIWLGSLHSIVGSMLLCFAHGFCSSGLFLGVNVVYSSSGTRNILLNRGFLYVFPMFMFLWFMLCACNCSLPVSLNFISEMLLVSSGLNYLNMFFLVFIFNVFFSGLYCVYLYLLVSHGKMSKSLNFSESCKGYQTMYINLFYHFILIYFFFIIVTNFTSIL